MKTDIPLLEKIIRLIYQHINCYSNGEADNILKGLHHILKRSVSFSAKNFDKMGLDEFQSTLATINEKETRRKKDGVYYTPKDITEYIVTNAFLNYVYYDTLQVHPAKECIQYISADKVEKLLEAKVFDPTCGTAEFLISVVETKLTLLKTYREVCDADLVRIASATYGNDISADSVLLSKIRIYFIIISNLNDKTYCIRLAKILNKNFSTNDYIVSIEKNKYDIIIGNPPYVEYGKLSKKPDSNYGNIYADVLQNSIKALKNGGIIGFVVPISFVATSRMEPIRNYVYHKMDKLFAMNFADRPDCLFDGVHQKLTIILGGKGKNKCHVYSSSYYHWYHDERQGLLDNCKIYPVIPETKYIPKIGDQYEYSIFTKIRKSTGTPLANLSCADDDCDEIFLNMRACFWMKAFSFNPGSKEYKSIICTKEIKPYILAILNSSLFFLYWTVVSDCWHITNKELLDFVIPLENVNFDRFRILIAKLERKLEKTKKYIGSVQAQYEYKHRECKDEIDAIDEALQEVYHLTDEEVSFLKEYKLRYRMSYGTI